MFMVSRMGSTEPPRIFWLRSENSSRSNGILAAEEKMWI